MRRRPTKTRFPKGVEFYWETCCSACCCCGVALWIESFDPVYKHEAASIPEGIDMLIYDCKKQMKEHMRKARMFEKTIVALRAEAKRVRGE